MVPPGLRLNEISSQRRRYDLKRTSRSYYCSCEIQASASFDRFKKVLNTHNKTGESVEGAERSKLYFSTILWEHHFINY